MPESGEPGEIVKEIDGSIVHIIPSDFSDLFVLRTDVGREIQVGSLPLIHQDQIAVAVTAPVQIGLVIVIHHKPIAGIVSAVSARRIQKTTDFRSLFVRNEEDAFHILLQSVYVITDIVGIEGAFTVLQDPSVAAGRE